MIFLLAFGIAAYLLIALATLRFVVYSDAKTASSRFPYSVFVEANGDPTLYVKKNLMFANIIVAVAWPTGLPVFLLMSDSSTWTFSRPPMVNAPPGITGLVDLPGIGVDK